MARTETKRVWAPGRGLLGPLRPLIGDWRHAGRTKLGATTCRRRFSQTLGGKFIELRAEWRTSNRTYEEIALFGAGANKRLAFWSFTSDGKQSFGEQTAATEVHARALSFEAEMPTGRARMLYWPDDEAGFWFAVESRAKKGWNRFLEQHFMSA